MSHQPSISGLDHVAVHVNDLGLAKEFYEKVLGLSPSDISEDISSKGIVWYRLADGRQIHLFRTDDNLPINRAHLALQVESVEDWRQYLTDRNVEIVQPTVQLYNADRFFARDPSGNLIEFVSWS